MRLEIRWDETDTKNPGWYVQVWDGDELVTDSVKVGFPVDVDDFDEHQIIALRGALREAYPGAEISE